MRLFYMKEDEGHNKKKKYIKEFLISNLSKIR